MEFIIPIVGIGLGYLARHLIGENRWSKVVEVGKELLGSGEADTADEAAGKALIIIEARRLGEAAEKLKEASAEWKRQLDGVNVPIPPPDGR